MNELKRTATALGVVTVVLSVAAGLLPAAGDGERNADVAALLAAHENVLRAHREGDLDSWMAGQADDYVMVGRGEVMFPSKAQRRERLGPYLESTTFTEYRDLIDPIVKVSDDGTLGWVIVQVTIAGTRKMPGGETVPVNSVWGWIELYEKRDGAWLNVGNVSNMKPPE